MKRLFTILLLLILFSGCGSCVKTKVNSFADKSSYPIQTFVILPGDKDVPVSNLQFQEFSEFLRKALICKQFIQPPSSEHPDLAIFLNYGITSTEEERHFSWPVWGQTGVSSSQTNGTLSMYGNYGTYSSNTTYTPTYGVVGYKDCQYTKVKNTRFIDIAAYDLKAYREGKQVSPIWQTSGVSTGKCGDLRKVFPYLIAALQNYLGVSSGKEKSIIICSSNKTLKYLKSAGARIKDVSLEQKSKLIKPAISLLRDKNHNQARQSNAVDPIKKAKQFIDEIEKQ